MDCLSYYFDMDNNASCNSFYELIKYSINNRKLKEVINKILQYRAYWGNKHTTHKKCCVCMCDPYGFYKTPTGRIGRDFFCYFKVYYLHKKL